MQLHAQQSHQSSSSSQQPLGANARRHLERLVETSGRRPSLVQTPQVLAQTALVREYGVIRFWHDKFGFVQVRIG